MFGNIFIRDAFTFINTTDGYCIGKKDYDGIYKTIYENHTGDKINFYDVLENENQIIVSGNNNKTSFFTNFNFNGDILKTIKEKTDTFFKIRRGLYVYDDTESFRMFSISKDSKSLDLKETILKDDRFTKYKDDITTTYSYPVGAVDNLGYLEASINFNNKEVLYFAFSTENYELFNFYPYIYSKLKGEINLTDDDKTIDYDTFKWLLLNSELLDDTLKAIDRENTSTELDISSCKASDYFKCNILTKYKKYIY